jgi:hypothetical protein
LPTIRSLMPMAPLAAVLAAVLAMTAAGPAAAAGPSASSPGRVPTAVSAQPAVGKVADPDRVAGAGAVRPEAATLTDQELNGDFTGYGATGGSYTSVGASWVQPAMQCTNDKFYATVSITINGFLGSSSTAAEDLGTMANCATGTPVYSDYYATEQGQNDVAYGDVVKPGDNFFASISYVGSGSYTYDLYDVTQGWTEDHTYYTGAPTGNAEIGLTEWPGLYAAPVEFGAVGFGNATINGTGLGAVGAKSYVQDSLETVANLTSISTVKATNGSFMMFYGAGGNVDANPLIAFEANDTSLWTSASDSGGYLGQLLAPGTSPSIAVLSDNGFEEAFQNANGALEVLGTDYSFNSQAGMMAGTSPSIAAGPNGTFEVAFQANSGQLWTFSPSTYGVNQSYGMKVGTSPAITAVSGGYQIAFQANTGALWAVGASGNVNTGLSMLAGTSPAIAANSANAYEAAFQTGGGQLWTYSASAGVSSTVNTGYSMMAGTNPALVALPDKTFEIAFQANTGYLWNLGSYYTHQTTLAMMAGTSPGITADPSVGFEVAFQANTSALWIESPSTGGVNWGSGMHSGSSPSIAY